MNILFINSKSPDYVEDQLFSALTEILGKKAVTAYPVNYKKAAHQSRFRLRRSIHAPF